MKRNYYYNFFITFSLCYAAFLTRLEADFPRVVVRVQASGLNLLLGEGGIHPANVIKVDKSIGH